MAQYPVQVNFSFEVDLDIAESQLPSVKTSIITDNIPEEPISFNMSQQVSNYYHTVYIYGDGTLLYAGRILESITNYNVTPGSQISTASIQNINNNLWRAKYPHLFGSNYYPRWTNTGYYIAWSNIGRNGVGGGYDHDGTYYLRAPTSAVTSLPYPTMPYTNITMKINTGITDAEADAINSEQERPSNTTFPHLELVQPTRTGGASANLNKLWIKLGKEKYRLKVYGYFFKFTNKKPTETTVEYTEATYVYNTKTWTYTASVPNPTTLYRSGYSLTSSTSTTKSLTLYEPEYNPSNVKLQVTYVNNRGHNEVRHYET
jgi:hypothetical protein